MKFRNLQLDLALKLYLYNMQIDILKISRIADVVPDDILLNIVIRSNSKGSQRPSRVNLVHDEITSSLMGE